MSEPAPSVGFDFASLPPGEIYRLLVSAIVPRPIAFISTLSAAGVGNLAPFSFFNAVAHDPPCLAVSITHKRGGIPKDTLRNILETRQFVVNSVAEWMAGPMNQCAAEYAYGVDEMREVGLTPVPSLRVRPVRVEESPIQMECELHQAMEIPDSAGGGTTLVIGRVVYLHVLAKAYRDGEIRLEEIKPLSRLGGSEYGLTPATITLPRPRV